MRSWALAAVVGAVGLAGLAPLLADQAPKSGHKLLVAFSSFRDRKLHPQIYFYEHDGVDRGKIIGTIDPVNQRSDSHPSLSRDGRYCAFAGELENQTSRILLWDLSEKKLITLPTINDSPNAQIHPTTSGAGEVLAFAAWDRAGFSQRWDILAYDVKNKKLLELPNLNTQKYDERMPSLSGNGRFLAFTSNGPGGAGLTDIYLYDRMASKVIALPEMNSPGSEITPSLNEDGRLICFVSDRPGGAGGRDVYLYDRAGGRFVDLPGLNSVAHEQTPSLSADGGYIAFVSERTSGLGERDVFVYDRPANRLLPTPGLNSKREDFDPSIIVLK